VAYCPPIRIRKKLAGGSPPLNEFRDQYYDEKVSPTSIYYPTLLYGVNPLLEALRAGRLPDQITIAEGARDERLRELIDLAGALRRINQVCAACDARSRSWQYSSSRRDRAAGSA